MPHIKKLGRTGPSSVSLIIDQAIMKLLGWDPRETVEMSIDSGRLVVRKVTEEASK